MSSSIGMCSLFYAVTSSPTSINNRQADKSSSIIIDIMKDSSSSSSSMPAAQRKFMRSKSAAVSSTAGTFNSYIATPREIIERYLFGFHAKTKRSLAEEAESGDETSVCSWIREGCDPDECDAYGYSPLLNAAVLGRLAAVNELIRNGADVNKVGPFGFTPLHAAAQNGHREVVFSLLANGADVNAQNDDKDTPIHLALRAQRIELVHLLVRSGGDLLVKGFGDRDCIQCASETGYTDLAKALRNTLVGLHTQSSPQFRS